MLLAEELRWIESEVISVFQACVYTAFCGSRGKLFEPRVVRSLHQQISVQDLVISGRRVAQSSRLLLEEVLIEGGVVRQKILWHFFAQGTVLDVVKEALLERVVEDDIFFTVVVDLGHDVRHKRISVQLVLEGLQVAATYLAF